MNGRAAAVSIWMGAILGVFIVSFPWSLGVWISVLAIALMNFMDIRGLSLGIFIGCIRTFLCLSLPWSHIDFDPDGKNHDLLVRVLEVSGSRSLVEVLEDGNKKLSSRPRLLTNALLENSGFYEIHGKVIPNATYDAVNSVFKERVFLSEVIRGKIQLTTSPRLIRLSTDLRDSIRNWIWARLESKYANLNAFRKAMILGDGSEISPQVWRSANFLGISHFLIISTRHLIFILFCLAFFGRKIFRFPLRWKFLSFRMASVATIFFFFSICRSDIALGRAFGAYLLAEVLPLVWPAVHRYRPVERLAWIGLFFLLLNPLSVLSPSYPFSFGASFALLCAFEWKSSPPFGLKLLIPYFAVSPIAFSLGLCTHFSSILWNILILPFFFLLLVPLASLPFFHQKADFMVHLFFSSIENASLVLARIQPPMHLAPQYSIPLLLICFFAIGTPNCNWKARLALLSLFVFAWPWVSSIPFDLLNQKPKFQLSIFDAGEGDALALHLESQLIMIDGGGSGMGDRQLFPLLLRDHQNEQDLWLLTHFDRDHIGHFQEIENRISPRQVLIPRFDLSRFSNWLQSQENLDLREAIKEPIHRCGVEFCFETWVWKNSERLQFEPKVDNQDSVVLIVSMRDSNDLIALFLGDLTARGEVELVKFLQSSGKKPYLGRLPVLKAAHHGSRTSTSDLLLATMRPLNVILTSSRQNRFGFPHEEILERIEKYKTKVWRVDAHGSTKLNLCF